MSKYLLRPDARGARSRSARSHPVRPRCSWSAARASSTCARTPSGRRGTSPAPPTSPRATSSSRSRPPRPTATEPVVLYCAGGVRSLFAAQTLAAMGYTEPISMKGGFQAWKTEGRDVDQAGRPDQGAEAALQPPPADPGGRRGGPGEAAGQQGAVHRRRRARLTGTAVPRGGRRGHHRHRRLRCRGPVQPPAPDRAHQRSRRPQEGGVAPRRPCARSTRT